MLIINLSQDISSDNPYLSHTLLKTIEKNIKLNNENLCCVPFFKKADLNAITKSSLLDSIISSTQIT